MDRNLDLTSRTGNSVYHQLEDLFSWSLNNITRVIHINFTRVSQIPECSKSRTQYKVSGGLGNLGQICKKGLSARSEVSGL